MMKKIILIILFAVSLKAGAQISNFKNVNINGWLKMIGAPQINSIGTDSTTFYGSNNKLITEAAAKAYARSMGGGGGSTDTMPLHNQILERVRYGDTAAMLVNYRHWLQGYLKSADIAGKVNVSDTAAMLTNYRHWLQGYLKAADIVGKVNVSDTAAMLTNYRHWLQGYLKSADIVGKVNVADTAAMLTNYRHWLQGYLKAADIAGKVNVSDTAAMLTNYRHWLQGYLTNADVSAKLNTSDTAAMLVNYRHWLQGYLKQSDLKTFKFQSSNIGNRSFYAKNDTLIHFITWLANKSTGVHIDTLTDTNLDTVYRIRIDTNVISTAARLKHITDSLGALIGSGGGLADGNYTGATVSGAGTVIMPTQIDAPSTLSIKYDGGETAFYADGDGLVIGGGPDRKIRFRRGNDAMNIMPTTGNILMQNGGTFTDNGLDRVQITGNVLADTGKFNLIRMVAGAGANKILTSDASGNASWQNITISSNIIESPVDDFFTYNVNFGNKTFTDSTLFNQLDGATTSSYFKNDLWLNGNYTGAIKSSKLIALKYGFLVAQDLTQKLIFQVGDSSTDLKIGLGITDNSLINGLRYQMNYIDGFTDSTNSSLVNMGESTNTTTNTGAFIKKGDYIQLQVNQVQDSIDFIYTNLTTKETILTKRRLSYQPTETISMTGYPAIYFAKGNVKLISYSVKTNVGNYIFIGNSLTANTFSATYDSAYVNLLKKYTNADINNFSKQAATCFDFLSVKKDFDVKGKTFFLSGVFGNDPFAGRTTSQIKADYLSLVSKIKKNGNRVVHIDNPFRATILGAGGWLQLDSLNNWIDTAFSGIDSIIHVGSTLVYPTDYADGVHLNQIGNTKLAELIRTSNSTNFLFELQAGGSGGSGTAGAISKFATSTTLTDAVAGTDYLAPSGNGSALTGITPAQVGLGNVTNESKATMFTSPTFTGNAVFGSPASGNFSTGTFTWPTFNQNTTGTALNFTGTTNNTLITASALSLPGSQVTGNIAGNSANVTGVVATANGGVLTGGTSLQVYRKNLANTGYEWATVAGLGDAVTTNGLQQFTGTTLATLDANASPATPAADKINIFDYKVGGANTLGYIGSDGVDHAVQNLIARNGIKHWGFAGNSTTTTQMNAAALTATGTATAVNVATTNKHTQIKGIEYLVTVAATTAVAGFRDAVAQYFCGNTAGSGGFKYICRFGPATGVATTTNRCFVGIGSSTAAPTDVEPSSILNQFGVGWDAADANIQVMSNDGIWYCN